MADERQQTILDFSVASEQKLPKFLNVVAKGMELVRREMLRLPPFSAILGKDPNKPTAKLREFSRELDSVAKKSKEFAPIIVRDAARGVGKQIAGAVEKSAADSVRQVGETFAKAVSTPMADAIKQATPPTQNLVKAAKGVGEQFAIATDRAGRLEARARATVKPTKEYVAAWREARETIEKQPEQIRRSYEEVVKLARSTESIIPLWDKIAEKSAIGVNLRRAMTVTPGSDAATKLTQALSRVTDTQDVDKRYTDTKRLLKEADALTGGALKLYEGFKSAVSDESGKMLKAGTERTQRAVAFINESIAALNEGTGVVEKKASVLEESIRDYLTARGTDAKSAAEQVELFNELETTYQKRVLSKMTATGASFEEAFRQTVESLSVTQPEKAQQLLSGLDDAIGRTRNSLEGAAISARGMGEALSEAKSVGEQAEATANKVSEAFKAAVAEVPVIRQKLERATARKAAFENLSKELESAVESGSEAGVQKALEALSRMDKELGQRVRYSDLITNSLRQADAEIANFEQVNGRAMSEAERGATRVTKAYRAVGDALKNDARPAAKKLRDEINRTLYDVTTASGEQQERVLTKAEANLKKLQSRLERFGVAILPETNYSGELLDLLRKAEGETQQIARVQEHLAKLQRDSAEEVEALRANYAGAKRAASAMVDEITQVTDQLTTGRGIVDPDEIAGVVEAYRSMTAETEQQAIYEAEKRRQLEEIKKAIEEVSTLIEKTPDERLRDNMIEFKQSLEYSADVLQNRLNTRFDQAVQKTQKMREQLEKSVSTTRRLADTITRISSPRGGRGGFAIGSTVPSPLPGISEWIDQVEQFGDSLIDVQQMLGDSKAFKTFTANMGKAYTGLSTFSRRLPGIGRQLGGLLDTLGNQIGKLGNGFFGSGFGVGLQRFLRIGMAVGVAIEGVNLGLDAYNRLMGTSAEQIERNIEASRQLAQRQIGLFDYMRTATVSGLNEDIRRLDMQRRQLIMQRDQAIYSADQTTDAWAKLRTVIEGTPVGQAADEIRQFNEEISKLELEIADYESIRTAVRNIEQAREAIQDIGGAVREFVDVQRDLVRAQEEFDKETLTLQKNRLMTLERQREQDALEAMFEQEDWERERLDAWNAHLESVKGIQDDLIESIQKAEEELAKERAKSYEDLIKSMREADEETEERILEAEAEFNERELEIEADYQKERAKEQKQYAKERLRREQDLYDQLTDLEIDNDALGFIRAQRDAAKERQREEEDRAERMEEERQEREEAKAERLKDHLENIADIRQQNEEAKAEQRKQFDEMWAEREEQHQESLEQFRKQAAERIQEEIESYKKQEALAWENLEREEYRQQLRDAMQRRWDEIDRQREEDQRQQAHRERMEDLQAQADEQRRILEEMGVDVDSLMRRVNDMIGTYGDEQYTLERKTKDLIQQYTEEAHERLLELEDIYWMERQRIIEAQMQRAREEAYRNSFAGQYNAFKTDFDNRVYAGVHGLWGIVSGLATGQFGIDTVLRAAGARAEGGQVEKGKPYKVGERGTEIFVPKESGTIIPNSKVKEALADEYGERLTQKRTLIQALQGTTDITAKAERATYQANKEIHRYAKTAPLLVQNLKEETESHEAWAVAFEQDRIAQIMAAAQNELALRLAALDELAEETSSIEDERARDMIKLLQRSYGAILNVTALWLQGEAGLRQQGYAAFNSLLGIHMNQMGIAYKTSYEAITQFVGEALTDRMEFERDAYKGLTKDLMGFSDALMSVGKAINQAIAQMESSVQRLMSMMSMVASFGSYGSSSFGGYSPATGVVGLINAGIGLVRSITSSALPTRTLAGVGGGGGRALRARATGGDVAAGMPYLVGERGMELFIPNTAGRIVPNREIMPFLRNLQMPRSIGFGQPTIVKQAPSVSLKIDSISIGNGVSRSELNVKFAQLQKAVVEAVSESVQGI